MDKENKSENTSQADEYSEGMSQTYSEKKYM